MPNGDGAGVAAGGVAGAGGVDCPDAPSADAARHRAKITGTRRSRGRTVINGDISKNSSTPGDDLPVPGYDKAMNVDTTAWTGEGSFTPVLIDALKTIDAIEFVRVEDAPASRADSGYAFISNEVYVKFRVETRRGTVRRFGIPWPRQVDTKLLTMAGLEAALGAIEGVGAPDYGDPGMLQYLRTERIVAPYQAKGVKVVEMVRIYEAGAASLS